MKLYIYEHCPFCTRARMAIGLKGMRVDLSVIMEGDGETPTRMIGKKMLPILEKPDGSHMGESLDIVHYLDKLGQPVFDDSPDPALDAWVQDAWPVAVKLFVPRFTKADFAELATPAAREAFRLRHEKAFGDLDALLAQTPALTEQMAEKLAHLAPLLAGRDRIGINDITLWPLLQSLSIVRGLHFPDDVAAYMNGMAAKAGVPLLSDQAM